MNDIIKIAVAGEGPIGLITIAKLIITHEKNKSDSKKILEITLYTKYDTYSRRHVLFLSNGIVNKLENEILNVSNSIRNGNSGDIQVSTRLLENTLFNNIKEKAEECESKQCKIRILTKKLFTINEYRNYDHVFIAAGFQADIRKQIMNNGENYLPLLAMSEDIILVLYTGIAPISSTNYMDDIGSRFDFIGRDIVESYRLDVRILTSFITTIYKYNKFIKSFDEKEKTKDLWVTGFSNYANFISIFEESIMKIKRYLSSNTIESVIKIYNENKSSPTEIDKLILESLQHDTDLYKEIWNKYKQMVERLLIDKDCKDKLFMLHSVNLSTKCNGCYLDTNNIEFCKKKEDTYIWLIGDSAIAYEATYSLELNLTYVNYIIPKFYKFYIKGIPMLFTNKKAKDIFKKIKINDELKTYNFSGGYLDSDIISNTTFKNIQEIIKYIISEYDRNNIYNDDFMKYYNLSYFIYYIKNLSKIMYKKIPIYKFRKTYDKFHILKYLDKSSSITVSSKQSRSNLSYVSSKTS